MSLTPCLTNRDQVNTLFALSGAAGGGSNTYPLISSIGNVSTTVSSVYTGSGGASFTDIITFEPGHAYNLSWVFTTSNVGDFTGQEVVTLGTSLAIAGGRYYSPPALYTGANTDDGALLTGSMNFPPAATAWSTSLNVGFLSPNNPSSITSYFGPGLSGGYRLTLTDFGLLSE